ncbi:type II and III secretion system protein family protein [Sphingomonas sp. MG17]|uniref:Type II and III secretion system protein family protein n=1 Tax=Sphingomonas tagetis TaxID=2949092 RepID=A0A9X2KKM8_9SPHN|nr:type II and III secretion system protein family protein [Sphingomonas tagetis]MCP3729536.1 type II and III secretion system protein family protein [Sphingomonas tagetis]
MLRLSGTLAAAACVAQLALTVPAAAQAITAAPAASTGEVSVPVNKSQVVVADRPFAKVLIGNADIADVVPLTNRSVYVLGKKQGTTSLTLYDRNNTLIAVMDVAVGPDVVSLRRQLSELMPNEPISVRASGDSVVLSGVVSSGPAVDRAKQIAATFAGDKVVNLLSVGATQQVMLEVRFSEMNRTAAKQLGFNNAFLGKDVRGGTGSNAPQTTLLTDQNGRPIVNLQGIIDSFGVGVARYGLGPLSIVTAMDALERKGIVTTLAEPTLIALSGESASFLAGGEFPVPVAQGGTGSGNGATTITVEFKPFGVSLAFTPTVLDDGVINLEVAPEVSSIDPSASVQINGLTVPGLQTRRAKTTLELRDGQSFAIAGLLRNDFQDTVRQFPVLGSIPILGALFRSTGFQKQETELVIIVTPRLVKPVSAGTLSVPTDRVMPPSEGDLFGFGRTDRAVGINPLDPYAPPPETKKAKPPARALPQDDPSGYEMRK